MKIRLLETPGDTQAFRAIRIESVMDAPASFRATEQEIRSKPIESFQKQLEDRMTRATNLLISKKQSDFESPARLLESLSYQSVLERGFAVVRDDKGRALSEGKNINPGASLGIEFHDGIVDAVAGSAGKKPAKKKRSTPTGEQGQLL